MKSTLCLLAVIIGVPLTLAMLLTWERPPMASTQLGPRGLGMVEIDNPRRAELLNALNRAAAVADPVADSGTKASAVYTNLKVLGDLDVEQFNRLMLSITEWVAPTEGDNAGCNYCHNPENLADDSVYTKIVARRMIEMTRQINAMHKPHVAETGVTCYTCHRGRPVPANVWTANDGPRQAMGQAARRNGQNLGSKVVGSTSLPYDPFSALLAKDGKIRVESTTALPTGTVGTMQETEATYALMMNISKALGVNCTFCHNSRQFAAWNESRPQRVTAWHGVKMVSDINATFLDSLKGVFPADRLGPHGDVAKVNCATCHNGQSKPLGGESMAKGYPELSVPNP